MAKTAERIDTGYIRGVLDSAGKLVTPRDGHSVITDYWRKVVIALCDELDRLESSA